jgi:hypothetical protein
MTSTSRTPSGLVRGMMWLSCSSLELERNREGLKLWKEDPVKEKQGEALVAERSIHVNTRWHTYGCLLRPPNSETTAMKFAKRTEASSSNMRAIPYGKVVSTRDRTIYRPIIESPPLYMDLSSILGSLYHSLGGGPPRSRDHEGQTLKEYA